MTTTFKTTGRDLKTFFAPLLKAASRDDMLPVLCSVQLRGIDGTLVGASTDRFRAAFHRHRPTEYEGDDFAFLIPARAAQRLLSVFGPTRANNPALEVMVDGDRLAVTDHSTTMTVEAMGGTYPALETLLAKHASAEGAPQGTFGINPRNLADILACAKHTDLTAIIRAPIGDPANNPALVQVTQDLLVLVMPRRVMGGEDDNVPVTPAIDLDAWTELLDGKR